MIPAYGVYFGIAVCLLFTLSSAFTALQTSFIAPPTFSLGLDLARERAGRYALRLEGSTLYFEGSFERGATAKLETLLGDQPGVTKIVLTSSGGNIFEGRGVGKVIAANNLATHVTGDCFSACTRACIAGRVRPEDEAGVDYDSVGHIDGALLTRLAGEQEAHFLICGPTKFMADLQLYLEARGIDPSSSITESFG